MLCCHICSNSRRDRIDVSCELDFTFVRVPSVNGTQILKSLVIVERKWVRMSTEVMHVVKNIYHTFEQLNAQSLDANFSHTRRAGLNECAANVRAAYKLVVKGDSMPRVESYG
jgi:hypothetical protein